MKFSFSGILLAASLALLPFVNSQHLFSGAVNAKLFFVLGVVIIATFHFVYMLVVHRHTLTMRSRWLLLLLGCSVGVLYLTTLTGVYPENSLFSTYLRSTGVLFLTAVAFLAFWASEFLSDRDWSLVRRAVAGSAALFAFFAFLGSEGLGITGQLLSINFAIDGLTLGNSTFAGVYVLLAFVITLIEFFRTGSRRARYALGGAAALQFFSPLLFNFKLLIGDVSFAELFSSPFALTGTAQASSATAFAVLAYILGLVAIRRFISQKPAVNIAWAGLWLLGIGTALTLLFVPGSLVQEKFVEASSAARPIVWDSAFEAVKERPIFGWGPENFRFAVQEPFDNRLYLKENIGEIWFDRAHNLFLDTLVTVGVLGLLVFAGLSLYFVFVAIRAWHANVIGPMEANLLGVLIAAQVLQLQTAFDTVVTYTLMAVMLGYVLSLERKLTQLTLTTHARSQTSGMGREWFTRGLAGALTVLAIAGSVYLVDEYQRQKALFMIFVSSNDREQQIAYIHEAMSRTNDFEALRLGSASLARGLFGELSAEEEKRNEHIIRGSVEQLAIFGEYWEKHLEEYPDDYRARMNYSYQLLVRTVFGEGEHFDEAQSIIRDSYALSPGNPLTYVLEGLTLLYRGDVTEAQEKMNEALALNPDIPFSQNMVEYVNEQAESFPEITVTKLQNL